MNRTVALAAAGVLLACLPPPAVADDRGQTCGMSAVRDAAGRTVRAVVTGGPWRTDSGRPDAEVTIRCRIEYDDGYGGRVVGAEVAAYSTGGVAVLGPAFVTFDLQATVEDVLYLCTEVTVYDPGAYPAYRVRHVDADRDPSNGAQCAKTEPESNDFVYVYSEPPQQAGGAHCTFVGHGIGPTYLSDPLPDVPAPPDHVCEL